MSKFYTFEELRARIPKKEEVARTRDLIRSFLREKSRPGQAVIYGSSAWGLNPEYGDQHTRRSDVDVAITSADNITSSTGDTLWKSGQEDEERTAIKDFCVNVSRETGVPVQVIVAGESTWYQALINPSTADHFRLLAKAFPKEGYREFRRTMKVHFKARLEDLEDYLDNLDTNVLPQARAKQMCPSEEFETPVIDHDLGRPISYLDALSTLENFPDHLIRKILGREKLLPCPDSKSVVRKAFHDFPFTWPIREKLKRPFAEVWQLSSEYEELINRFLNRFHKDEYTREVERIGSRLIDLTQEAVNIISRGDLADNLSIVRIPRATPVIILTHFGKGEGTAYATVITEPFGNPKEGITYPSGYAQRRVEEKARNGRVVTRFEPTDTFLYHTTNNLRWINDPIDLENGWFTYEDDLGTKCSIKPCTQEVLRQFLRDTDKDKLSWRKVKGNKKRYYQKFAKTALDPKLSRLPKSIEPKPYT